MPAGPPRKASRAAATPTAATEPTARRLARARISTVWHRDPRERHHPDARPEPAGCFRARECAARWMAARPRLAQRRLVALRRADAAGARPGHRRRAKRFPLARLA